MWIKKFSVLQLHGMLDLELNFNEDLTIIVGRNGAGKTSALNLIADILRINLKGILSTSFAKAELNLVDDEKGVITITVDREAEVPHLEVRTGEKVVGQIPLTTAPEIFSPWDSSSMSLARKYGLLSNLKDLLGRSDETQEAKKMITEGVNLTFVRLDRTIITTDALGDFNTENTNVSAESKRAKGGDRRITEPIDVVRAVTKSNYLGYKAAHEKIKATAVEQLLRLQFIEHESTSSIGRRRLTEKKLEQQIEELERKVSLSSLVQDTPGLSGPVEKFFKETRRLLELSFKPKKTKAGRRTKAEEELESVLLSRQWRVQKLLEIFEAEQTETAEAYKRLKTYLDSAQEFFNDSEKDLSFHPKHFELRFRPRFSDVTVLDENDSRSLAELSSGEKQVLIILTYLAFLANDQSIFMVDEPELSLHLKWQRGLVKVVSELRPPGCQIIMATHAPEIAGPAFDKCYPLAPKSVHP
jgi:predicted ATPase